jgi:1-deoxy-D-xylulose-5-phosphate synthase
MSILDKVNSPDDLRKLSDSELDQLSTEIREFIVDHVSLTGGHLGSNLGAVEMTLALHLSFKSPKDILLFDTGHQAYVHKILTGRKNLFDSLRQEGGLSGYPSRRESEHDWIENSHASTALSYAYGLATSLELKRGPYVGTTEFQTSNDGERYVVAVVGDGALTGGLAYEALNNLGHSDKKVIIVWNDNGRSYAPTISRLSSSLTKIRLNPAYMQARERIRHILHEMPKVGTLASTGIIGVTTALREAIEPRVFFEALGVRYTGPIDGHDIEAMRYAFNGAKEWDSAIVIHIKTEKGHGYEPAILDEIQCLHDLKLRTNAFDSTKRRSFTETFSEDIVRIGAEREEIVAITAAMPGPTGLLNFQSNYPTRFFDVGIAEGHAVTSAAGMAMGGLRPVVAIYSTFINRAYDQVNFDVALHNLPVLFVLDRAGVTGDDGASHNGTMDIVEMMAVPNMTFYAPSTTSDLTRSLEEALKLPSPAAIRFPKTPGPISIDGVSLTRDGKLKGKILRDGSSSIAIVAVGKMAEFALDAANHLGNEKIIDVTVIDPQILKPIPEELLTYLATYKHILTVEDGFVPGGYGSHLDFALCDKIQGASPKVIQLGIPIEFLSHAKVDSIHKLLEIDTFGIAQHLRNYVLDNDLV